MIPSSFGQTSAEGAPALSLVPQMEPYPFGNSTAATTIQTASKAPQMLPAHNIRQQLSKDEWESLKPLIQRLYIEENQTFRDIATTLRDSHGFFPTYGPSLPHYDTMLSQL